MKFTRKIICEVLIQMVMVFTHFFIFGPIHSLLALFLIMTAPFFMKTGWWWCSWLLLFPAWNKRCPWELIDGKMWSKLLRKHPSLSAKCSWEKISEEDAVYLLERQPQLITYLPYRTFSGWWWKKLLSVQPECADYCPWEKLSGKDWADLLIERPEFANICPWEKLRGGDWFYLLLNNSQFRKNFPARDPEIMCEYDEAEKVYRKWCEEEKAREKNERREQRVMFGFGISRWFDDDF